MSRKRPPDWLLGLLLLAGIYLWQRTTFPLWMVDLFHIQYSAYEWKHGEVEWMYAKTAVDSAWIEHRAPVAEKLGAEGHPNEPFYPPFLAAVLSPVAEAPAMHWRNVVFAINVALLFVFAGMIVRACEIPLTVRSFLWSLVLVLMAYPMARATKLGQIVPLQAALIWAAVLALKRSRETLSGVLLGIVSAVKLFPFGLVLVPLSLRRFRTTAIMIGTVVVIYGLALIALGLRVHELWWTALSGLGSSVCPFFGNQAPAGWALRLATHVDMVFEPAVRNSLTDILRAASMIIFGGGTVWVLWRARRNIAADAHVPLTGLVMSGIILAIPMAWEHYWMFVLPAVGWAIHESWTRGDRRGWELWLALATFFFTMKLTHFYNDSLFGRVMSGSQTMGMLMVWIWFARQIGWKLTRVNVRS